MSDRFLCPACTFDKISYSYVKEGYDVWRCEGCGTMFVHDVPDAMDLEKIYAAADYYEMKIDSERRIQKENIRRLKIIKKYKIGGSFFDIGCARGLLLDEAKSAGYDTFGIELSRENVKLCEDKNHKVIHGYLDSCQSIVPTGGFDVITCLDVIEHVEEPIDFLRTAASMLNEYGIMVVSTPNYSGLVARILKMKDPYMTPPEHLNYFTHEGMSNIFQKNCLLIKKKVTFGYLVESELGRVFSKYGSAFLAPVEPFVKPLIPFVMHGLNAINMGLEQEFYLSKGE